MAKENIPDPSENRRRLAMEMRDALTSSENRKRLALELHDALMTMRSLLVATVSLVITLAESRPKPVNTPFETTSSPKNFKPSNETEFHETTLNPIETSDQAIPGEPNLEEAKPTSNKEMMRNPIYPVLAVISTVTLIVGVSRLAPIAQWAKTQNECIEQTIGPDESSQDNLANKVKNCNGGHD